MYKLWSGGGFMEFVWSIARGGGALCTGKGGRYGRTSARQWWSMIGANGRSCCLFGAPGFNVPQHFGNPQQIVGQHRRAHQHFKALAAVGAAALHAAAAK